VRALHCIHISFVIAHGPNPTTPLKGSRDLLRSYWSHSEEMRQYRRNCKFSTRGMHSILPSTIIATGASELIACGRVPASSSRTTSYRTQNAKYWAFTQTNSSHDHIYSCKENSSCATSTAIVRPHGGQRGGYRRLLVARAPSDHRTSAIRSLEPPRTAGGWFRIATRAFLAVSHGRRATQRMC
jgi:hypothetical protein